MAKLLTIIRLTFTLTLFLVSVNSMAIVYYISANGNDDNPGTSPELAWKSLTKVNAQQFGAGDEILFKRGDEWRGTLHCNYSGTPGKPIKYGAYGEGANPVIFGSEIITGWTNHSGNIYKASVASDIVQVFIDGDRVSPARYPNESYHTITAVPNSTTLTSPGLDPGINYKGATWFGRTRYYFNEIREVYSSNGNSLTLVSAPSRGLAVNTGFVLMNKLEFLDQAGEWYFDKTNKELYLWTPSGDSPENFLITGSANYNGVHINRKNYLSITDLDLREQGDNGIYINSANNIVLENLNIWQSDRYGVSAEGAHSLVIKNNKIDGANGGGLWLWTNNSQITDNWINNIGVFSEIGLKGTSEPNGGSGAEISGEKNVIQYNLIENTNYNGLFYRGAGSRIEFNHINNTCLVKDDGGGIYTNTSGSGGIIRYNIVTNSIGNPDGYISSRSMAEGIYIDEIAQGVVVEYNTVYNTGDAAIKLHHVGGIKVDNNTVMTARYGVWCNRFVGQPSPITNNTIYMTTNKDDYEPRALFSRVGDYNTQFDYNKYYNPTVNASAQMFKESNYLTFTQWKAVTNQDANSNFINTPLANGETVDLIYNTSKLTKKYTLNNAVARDLEDNSIESTFSLEPYHSIIIIGKNLEEIEEIPDTIAPTISTFTIPSSVSSISVPIESFIATDDSEVTGYLITENDMAPDAGHTGWSGTVPVSYEFDAPGEFILYAWAKDAAGNVSESASAEVTIAIPAVVVDCPESVRLTSCNENEVLAAYNNWLDGFSYTGGHLVTDNLSEVPTLPVDICRGVDFSFTYIAEDDFSADECTSTFFVAPAPDFSPTYIEYLFEEESGETIFDSNNTFDATIINEVIRGEGIKDLALEFTGSGYIDAGTEFGNRIGDELAVSMWIKPSSGNNENMWLVVQDALDSTAFELYVNHNTRSIGFKTSGTSEQIVLAEDVDVLWDGEWHHLVASYNGTEKTIYIDNNQLINVVADGFIKAGAGYNLLIGANPVIESNGLNYNGYMDELRIYNYGLSVDDVNDLYYEVVDSTTSVGNLEYNRALNFYPNPFSKSISIEYSGQDNLMKLEIYSASGILVKSFAQEGIHINNNYFVWDGRNAHGEEVTPGFYFIRLINNSNIETGKILKLK